MGHLRLLAGIDDIDAESWDRLLDATAPGYPFLRHAFLRSLEASGSLDHAADWHPCHLLLTGDDGRAVAAAPLYRKYHSFGEFVFDFGWAEGYRRLGLDYYPKLVCAVPFTPVVGPRLLAADANARTALAEHLAALPAAESCSSLHLLFGAARDRASIRRAGALLRRDCHYLWRNRGYADFEGFLAALSSKRRKEIRRERRRVADAGIRVRVLTPDQVDHALMTRLYRFYARTYLIRGQAPYLPPEFFDLLGAGLPDNVRYFVAYEGDTPVAFAFMVLGTDTLYGRHWGCLEDYHSLHFETCYYAGIEYCIERGLRYFDAGAQGEHKIRRGFEPMATYSGHFIVNDHLRHAIADFVDREAEAVTAWHREQRQHCAFPQADEILR